MSAIGHAISDVFKGVGHAIEGVATLNPSEALSGVGEAAGGAMSLTPEGAAATLLQSGVDAIGGQS